MTRLLLILACVPALLLPTRAQIASTPSLDQPLRVHIHRGLWSREYRIEEALEASGGAIVTSSWDSMGTGFGWLGHPTQGKPGGARWFPTAPELAQVHLLIIVNTNVANLRRSQQVVADYVQNGGAVLFLGGRYALGKAQQESPLSAVTPATFAGEGRLRETDLYPAPEGLPLQPHGDHFADLDWSAAPHLYWYHAMTPREGTELWLASGDIPLLVLGTYGHGRSAVFAGTVLGEAAEGQVPFWQWQPWPDLLAETIAWLIEARDDAPRGIPAPLLTQLTAMSESLSDPLAERQDADPERLAELFIQAAWQCHDTASMEQLLTIATRLPMDIPMAVAHILGRVQSTQARPAAEPHLQRLLASGQAAKTTLALYLLGAIEADGAAATLADFYASGKPRERQAEVSLDLDFDAPAPSMGTPMEEPMTLKRNAVAIRLAALTGLGYLESAEANQKLQAVHPEGAINPSEFPDMMDDANRAHQQWLLARLRCGDTDAAEPLLIQLVENIYLVSRARTEKNKVDERLEAVNAALPETLRWQRELYRQLAHLPEAPRQAMLERVAEHPEPRAKVIRLALLALLAD